MNMIDFIRDEKVFAFIKEYVDERGHAPGIRTVADAIAVTPDAVRASLLALEHAGRIKGNRSTPSLTVIQGGRKVSAGS